MRLKKGGFRTPGRGSFSADGVKIRRNEEEMKSAAVDFLLI